MATAQETPTQQEEMQATFTPTQTQPAVASAHANPTPTTNTTTAAPTPHSAASSIEVTTRDDLSLLYRVLRFIIKPLRPRLIQPPKTPFPEGSPRLDPPKKRNIVIKETKFADVWMYHMHALGPDSGKRMGSVEKAMGPEEKADLPARTTKDVEGSPMGDASSGSPAKGRSFQRRHRVYYFSGGGFRAPPSGEHWRFIAQLAQDLSGHRSSVSFPGPQGSANPEGDAKIELIVVSYPLAPKSPAVESLRILRVWLSRLMDQAVQDGETLSLMGDSSGGNVMMSLGFWAVENWKPSAAGGEQQRETETNGSEDQTKIQTGTRRKQFPLASLLTISGPMDLTNSSPEIPHKDTLEVVLTAKLTADVASIYCGHNKERPSKFAPTPLSSLEVSPLFQPDESFIALRDKNVNIHGVYGTHDVLAPSGIDFMKKCQKVGVKGRWLVWEGQMHCFPLAGGTERLGISEGREARKFIETVLRGDAGMVD